MTNSEQIQRVAAALRDSLYLSVGGYIVTVEEAERAITDLVGWGFIQLPCRRHTTL